MNLMLTSMEVKFLKIELIYFVIIYNNYAVNVNTRWGEEITIYEINDFD